VSGPDAKLVREGLGRQPGCPIADCYACKARQERIDAGERLIAELAEATVLLRAAYNRSDIRLDAEWVQDFRRWLGVK
jgi:hypothetical protein